MTRADKLAYHLEMVIWAELPEGTRLNAMEIGQLMAMASEDQHRRAYARALIHSPLLLPDDEGL